MYVNLQSWFSLDGKEMQFYEESVMIKDKKMKTTSAFFIVSPHIKIFIFMLRQFLRAYTSLVGFDCLWFY